MELEGVIESIIFHNEENLYTVANLLTEDGEIVIVGHGAYLKKSQPIKVVGDFVFHDRFGIQFQFTSYNVQMPKKESEVVRYLGSGILPHIGEKMAERIVEEFGEETLRILDTDVERLSVIPGLGKKRISDIKAAIEEERKIRDFLLSIAPWDIPTSLAIKIFREYGSSAKEIIEENPYLLADHVKGIGFMKADQIALQVGIERDHPFRILSGIKYVLKNSVQEGHTYLPLEELKGRSLKLLGISVETLENQMMHLMIDPDVYIAQGIEGKRAYLLPLYEAENLVASKIVTMSEEAKTHIPLDFSLEKMEESLPYTLDPAQREAVEKSLSAGFLIITGGPGTGKTTTLKSIVYVMESMGKKVALAAPTGRAAKRMEEATGREAKTIHRMLQLDGSEEGGEETIDADVIIVDEASMIDILLMKQLMRSMEDSTKLILVGDVDQLPSVGPGNVLRDIITSEQVPVVYLQKIFRQEATSLIIENAHKINEGIYPSLNQKGGDFYFIHGGNAYNSVEIVTGLVKERLPNFYNFHSLEDIHVLAPMKKGICGVDALNHSLQEALNPLKGREEIRWNHFSFREGDKVMQIKNDYEREWKTDSTVFESKGKGIFNGDMGFIKQIDSEEMVLTVLYEDTRQVEYTRENLDQLIPAYATTIHKSQGSEFPCVIIPVLGGPPMLLTRNLIYTAITRAKQLVVLVGEEKYLHQMIDNNFLEKRYSTLDESLRKRGQLQ